MIRALLKKQLLELGAAFVRSSKTGKQRSRVGTLGYALLFAVLMLLVMLSFGSMALPLAVTLVPQGLGLALFCADGAFGADGQCAGQRFYQLRAFVPLPG